MARKERKREVKLMEHLWSSCCVPSREQDIGTHQGRLQPRLWGQAMWCGGQLLLEKAQLHSKWMAFLKEEAGRPGVWCVLQTRQVTAVKGLQRVLSRKCPILTFPSLPLSSLSFSGKRLHLQSPLGHCSLHNCSLPTLNIQN